MIKGYFCLFLHKTILRVLIRAILMSTHNIGFNGELTKIIFQLSSDIIKYPPYLYYPAYLLFRFHNSAIWAAEIGFTFSQIHVISSCGLFIVINSVFSCQLPVILYLVLLMCFFTCQSFGISNLYPAELFRFISTVGRWIMIMAILYPFFFCHSKTLFSPLILLQEKK